MPYEGELASKAHSDILKNPDIKAVLDECVYLKPPSDEEVETLAKKFVEPPDTSNIPLPGFVIAVDGSFMKPAWMIDCQAQRLAISKPARF